MSEYEVRLKKKITLGKSVKAFRVCEELTQEELAKKIGVTKQTISVIENEKMIPSFQMLINIAETLGYGVEIFLEQYLEKILCADNVDFHDFIEIKKAA
jgi:putative transcriptional regulator